MHVTTVIEPEGPTIVDEHWSQTATTVLAVLGHSRNVTVRLAPRVVITYTLRAPHGGGGGNGTGTGGSGIGKSNAATDGDGGYGIGGEFGGGEGSGMVVVNRAVDAEFLVSKSDDTIAFALKPLGMPLEVPELSVHPNGTTNTSYTTNGESLVLPTDSPSGPDQSDKDGSHMDTDAESGNGFASSIDSTETSMSPVRIPTDVLARALFELLGARVNWTLEEIIEQVLEGLGLRSGVGVIIERGHLVAHYSLSLYAPSPSALNRPPSSPPFSQGGSRHRGGSGHT